jgi:general secretion pathway protein K
MTMIHFRGKKYWKTGGPRGGEKGIALIMTLWLIIILGLTASYFSRGIRQEAFIVKNFKEGEEARLLAMAGVNHALALLSRPTSEGMNVDHNFLEDQFAEISSVSFNGGSYQVTVIDEESKININLATRDIIRGLLTSIGIYSLSADSICDAVLDWRDTDDFPMLNGAESDYYSSLDRPYSSKNSKIYDIDELLLVRGITPGLLYGLNPEDSTAGLEQYITVYGKGKININTANRSVLEALPGVDEQSSIFIVRGRGALDYKPLSKAEFIKYLQEVNPSGEQQGDYQQLQRLVDTKSYYFTIVSRGWVESGSIEKVLKVVVYRTILGQKVNLRIISWRELDQMNRKIS